MSSTVDLGLGYVAPSFTVGPSSVSDADRVAVGAVVDEVGAGLSESVRDCAVVRVTQRSDLVARVAGGDETRADDAAVVAGVVQSCVDAFAFAPMFAASAQSYSGVALSEDQGRCVQAAFVSLSEDDARALTAGAIDPNDAAGRARSQAITTQIFEGCGIAAK